MRQTETRSKLLTAESRGAVRESPLMRARKRGAPDSAARALARSVSSEGAELSADGKSIARAETTNPAKKRTELAPLTQSEERLLKNLLSEPMDYIDHPEYHLPDAAERIYGAAEIARPDVTWYRPLMDDFISTRSRGTRTPKAQSTVLLTGAQERVLFMKYNFARFSISEIQKQAASRSLTLVEAREMLRWHAIANQYREQLAETNLALVLAMAKRVRLGEGEFADLIGEGNMALMRSVDKFDCGRGFKFSTYACRAILKAFSRHGIKVAKHRQRFPVEFDPALEQGEGVAAIRAEGERQDVAELREIVETNRADLSEVERAVVMHRFALEGSDQGRPPTLAQVGRLIGLTKERVRQIQNTALEKLRMAIEGSGAPPHGPVGVN